MTGIHQQIQDRFNWIHVLRSTDDTTRIFCNSFFSCSREEYSDLIKSVGRSPTYERHITGDHGCFPTTFSVGDQDVLSMIQEVVEEAGDSDGISFEFCYDGLYVNANTNNFNDNKVNEAGVARAKKALRQISKSS